MFFDPMYFVFALPALLLALYAQARVRSTYARYSRVPNASRGFRDRKRRSRERRRRTVIHVERNQD